MPPSSGPPPTRRLPGLPAGPRARPGPDSSGPLKVDNGGDDPRGTHLQVANRRSGVPAQVPRDLEPAPFKPSRVPGQALPGRPRVPLVHAAWIEQQGAVACFHVRPVSVAEDDRVGTRGTPGEGWRRGAGG